MKDHIALIYRYSNPYNPKLTFYTEDDFLIETVKSEFKYNNSIKTDLVLHPYKLSDPYLTGYISIENTGNTILDTFSISSSKPDLTNYIDYIENNGNIILLPNQKYNIKFNIPFDKIEDQMFVVMNASAGTDVISNVYIEKEIDLLSDYKELDTLAKLLSILFYVVLLLGIYFIVKKVNLKKNG